MISSEWRGEPHERYSQRNIFVFILKKLELFDSFVITIDSQLLMETIYSSCQGMKCPDVHVRTLRRWWTTYLEWEELPCCVTKWKE